jgi:hypothetical protein
MATSDDVSDFITELENHFFPVKHDPESRRSAWMAAFARELRGFSTQVLVEAARDLILSRRKDQRYFPQLSECNDACHKARKRMDLVAKAQQIKVPNYDPTKTDPYAPWRREMADRLIIGDMGRKAAKEGWILMLHDFIWVNQRLPKKEEIPALRAAVEGFDEAYSRCAAVVGWKGKDQVGELVLSGKLAQWGESIIARRAELADRVENGVIGK